MHGCSCATVVLFLCRHNNTVLHLYQSGALLPGGGSGLGCPSPTTISHLQCQQMLLAVPAAVHWQAFIVAQYQDHRLNSRNTIFLLVWVIEIQPTACSQIPI